MERKGFEGHTKDYYYFKNAKNIGSSRTKRKGFNNLSNLKKKILSIRPEKY
jgi:hypothetical protein